MATQTWRRFHEKELTHSMAHYLQAVAGLKRAKGYAKVRDIAEALGVSKSGVTSMLRSLQSRGLVRHERYGLVELTAEGHRLAERTASSRQVLRMFFTDILRLPPETAEEDACMIEHLVSADSMDQFLRLTALIQSAHPTAEEFRTLFHRYQQQCESGTTGEGCVICKGSCLRESLHGA